MSQNFLSFEGWMLFSSRHVNILHFVTYSTGAYTTFYLSTCLQMAVGLLPCNMDSLLGLLLWAPGYKSLPLLPAVLYGNFALSWLRNYTVIFHSGCPSFPPHPAPSNNTTLGLVIAVTRDLIRLRVKERNQTSHLILCPRGVEMHAKRIQ